MKHLIALLLVVGVSFGQVINETKDGLNHQKFQVYYKSGYTSSTANETTAFIGTYDAARIAVWATTTDTVNGALFFQFKNSFTGYKTGWRAVSDSFKIIGTSSVLSSDRIHAFVPSDTSTAGYDLVRFYVDFAPYDAVAYTGGVLRIYTDIYKP